MIQLSHSEVYIQRKWSQHTVFTVALNTITKMWNQPRWMSTEEWIQWYEMYICYYIHNAVLPGHKEEWNPVICRKMIGNRRYHIKRNQSDTDNITCFVTCGNLEKKKWLESRRGNIKNWKVGEGTRKEGRHHTNAQCIYAWKYHNESH
jgi:hypothetical protein